MLMVWFVIGLFVHFPLLWTVSNGQITEIARDQPVLQETDLTRNCCQYLHDESNLLQCSNQSAYSYYSKINPSITAVSYSTDGILGYGAYSMAINTYYTQLHGYGMVLLTPGLGAQYEPRDQRWNKVKILIDALNPETGWARNSHFIVWLDSDLIFLDMGLDLQQIVDENPSYHMIFSADGDIQNGIVNSGCFIVKNTDWSRNFLERWWSSYDRVQGMDQHIFTRIWEQIPNIDNFILVLKPDALNSHLPASINQKDYNQILHLAGSSNVLRKHVFLKGFQAICENIQLQALRLPRQLGLTQPELLQLEKNLPFGDVAQQIITEMRSKSGKHIPISEVRMLYSKVLDLLQMGFDRPENDLLVIHNLVEGLKWSFDMFFNITLQNEINPGTRLESIQMTLDAMFNLVMRIGKDSYDFLLRTDHLIDELITSVRSEHYGPSLYYKFKQRQFLGIYLEEQGLLTLALQRYKESIAVWWEMHRLKSYGSGNGAHDPYAEGCGILFDIAALSYAHQDYQTCLESTQHIIHFYEEVWRSRSVIPAPVKQKHGARLGIGGSCAMAIGNDELAFKYLNEAVSIFKQFPEEMEHLRQTESLLATLKERKDQHIEKSLNPEVEEEVSVDGNSQQSNSRTNRMYRRKRKS